MIMLLQRFGIILSVILVAGILSAQEPKVRQPPNVNVFERFVDGQISSDPAQWDDETRKEFFGNMPTEYHQKFLDAHAKLRKTLNEHWKTRAELYTVTYPITYNEAGQAVRKPMGDAYTADAEGLARGCMVLYPGEHLHKFRHYPVMLDPGKQAEYWHALAEETLFLYDKTAEGYQQKLEEYRKLLVNPPERWDRSVPRHIFPQAIGEESSFQRGISISHITFPLTDEQKSRLLKDEPLLLGKTQNNFMNPDYYPQFAEVDFLKEARNAEREPWKLDTTPELAKLGINQAEVDRWDGSLSLHPVIHAIAERCEGVNAAALQTVINLNYQFDFGGSTRTGRTLSNTHPALMKLISGNKDVVFSTRRLSQKELDGAEKSGVELVQIPFAKDAFVFLQNRQNPLRNLTLEQYQDIFSGKFLKERQETWGVHKFQTWKDVGGFGGEIFPLTRDQDSGSEELMKMLVMRDVPISQQLSWRMLDGMSVVYVVLAQTPGGIAYTVYFYDRYMVFNPYTRVMGVNGVFPNAETIASGEYPLVYECVLVHRKNPGEKVERFVHWLLSDEGQRLVRSVGYVPMDKRQ